MTQYYKIENNYPVISPILLEGFTEYEVGEEPKELIDAFAYQSQLEIEQEGKITKQLALDTITVTTANGNVFDGRDKDRARMNEAITASDILGITTTQWKLHDNTVKVITLDELKEALALSIQATGAIIVG